MTFQAKGIILQLQDACVNVFRKNKKHTVEIILALIRILCMKILDNIGTIKVFTMKGREKWLKKLNPEFLSLS